jgi:hypothetical protein
VAFQLVGGSYNAESLNLDAQRSLNLYPSSDRSQAGRNIGALLGTPGISLLLTLPTSPVRGLWPGSERLFVVAGSKLYEVFVGRCSTSGTAVTWVSGYSDFTYMTGVSGAAAVLLINGVSYTEASRASSTSLTLTASAGVQTNVAFAAYYQRGDVGNDGNPVQMYPNGNQLFIVSNGLAWVDTGAGPVQANFQNGSGTVKTSGTAVTWLSGDKFDSSNLLGPIAINGVSYTVSSVTDATDLVLTSTAGTQDTTYTGTCNTSGTAVTWVSGSTFDAALSAAVASWAQNGDLVTITINSIPYTISSVTDVHDLVLTASAGAQAAVAFSISIGVAYTATYPVAASYGAFLDGYFIVINRTSPKQINISAYQDGTSWNPLDTGVKAGYPDNLAAILADHEELWMFGTETIEVWQDTGDANFPFQRNPGAFQPLGCVAPYSVARLAGGVAWLGGDPRSRCRAYLAKGFIPDPISTPAVENAWRGYPTIADAVSFSYSEAGHDIWVVHFPSGNATWAYDVTEGLWHERGWWNGSSGDNRQRQAFHAFVFDEHIVGDWENGNLYVQSLDTYTDNGTQIVRIRAASDISQPNLGWNFYSRFRLDAENSGALAPTFDYSIDGGHTFIDARTAGNSAASGEYAYWEWRRLGRSRARTLRITITAAVKVALINGAVEMQGGRG